MTSPAMCRQKIGQESEHFDTCFLGKGLLSGEETVSITAFGWNASTVPRSRNAQAAKP
jgi:hypothetical protein